MSEVKRVGAIWNDICESIQLRESSDGEFVKYEDYVELKAQRDVLAAENAVLKEFFSVGIGAAFEGCDWFGDNVQVKALELGLIREEKYDHQKHAESVFNPEDFQQGDAVFTINETPATDAYLNSVRAEGVELAAIELKELAKRSKSEAPKASEHTHADALYLMLFAAQLRGR